MKFRFSVSSFLILLGLVSVILTLQLRVNAKAKKFASDLEERAEEAEARLIFEVDSVNETTLGEGCPGSWIPEENEVDAKLDALSIGDVILFQRHCSVTIRAAHMARTEMREGDYTFRYRVSLFGEKLTVH